MHPTLRKILQITGIVLWTAALTVFTQVGGVPYLIARFSSGWIRRRVVHPWKLRLARAGYGIAIYLVFCLLIVPLLARPLGRVALPIVGESPLRPLRMFTVLLNRHYVRPALRDAAFEVAQALETRHPGTNLYYLDANFPFFDGFPLLPHLSHNDGKKLDLAFLYTDPEGKPRSGSPSWLGYGVYDPPKQNERNQPELCATQGQWQYSIIGTLVPQWSKYAYPLDEKRTQTMVELFAAQPAISKIFIEPHLKTRLNLNSPKVRFHGCKAARHDDHVHVQME
jgi:hypothetical protein